VNKLKQLTILTILITLLVTFIPFHSTEAASVNANDIMKAATSPSVSTGGENIFEKLFGFLFDKILGPLLNISSPSTSNAVTNTRPKQPSSTPITNTGILRSKVIVIDPGHGGSNPGAVACNVPRK